MKNTVNEMGNVKSTDFGARKGGFNVLNVPDELYNPDAPVFASRRLREATRGRRGYRCRIAQTGRRQRIFRMIHFLLSPDVNLHRLDRGDMMQSMISVNNVVLKDELKYKGTTLLTYQIEYPVFKSVNYQLSLAVINKYYKAKAMKYKKYCETELFRMERNIDVLTSIRWSSGTCTAITLQNSSDINSGKNTPKITIKMLPTVFRIS